MVLSREERDKFVEKEIRPLLAHFGETCSINIYDSDFTHANISDFIIIHTESLEQYGYLIGYLRESKTFAIPYFEIKELVVGVNNNFRGSIAINDIIGSGPQ